MFPTDFPMLISQTLEFLVSDHLSILGNTFIGSLQARKYVIGGGVCVGNVMQFLVY